MEINLSRHERLENFALNLHKSRRYFIISSAITFNLAYVTCGKIGEIRGAGASGGQKGLALVQKYCANRKFAV